jgi:hypothetical protein
MINEHIWSQADGDLVRQRQLTAEASTLGM